MARMTHPFFSGKTGDLVFYNYLGIPVIRTKPDHVRQTKGTKASAKLFGKAARISAALRKEMSHLFVDYPDKKPMYILNSAILKWLASDQPQTKGLTTELEFIDNAHFNAKTNLQDRMRDSFSVDWSARDKVTVGIPPLLRKYKYTLSAHTTSIEWSIAVVGCNIDNPYETIKGTNTEVAVVYDSADIPGRKIDLPFQLIKNGLHIVVVAMKFIVEKKGRVKQRRELPWLPIDIVGSCFLK